MKQPLNKEDLRDYFNRTAPSREKWKRRNRFYHRSLERYFAFIIPEGSRVLEVGCGPGDLLASLDPRHGVGIDFAPAVIGLARKKYPHLVFHVADAEDFALEEEFDFIILSDLAGSLWDIQKALHTIRKHCSPHTRVVISNFNYLWEGIMVLGERLRIKLPQPKQNWLTPADLATLLALEDFQVVTVQRKMLLPKYVPGLNFLFNRVLANLPLLNRLDLLSLVVARPIFPEVRDYSVSIVIPARNERGNIEDAIRRTPQFGVSQEFIFIEGHSSDHTYEEMVRVQAGYPGSNIRVMRQTGKGKGNAVREAFEAATGEILMILDADLTMPPEELVKFYDALCGQKGEFINGCRLVYPMEKEAMRFLNLIANKLFGAFFTYLLGQRLKDTLCGTKVLFRRDYETIRDNRRYFGDFDPFGDFDLLFGASKHNLKITEILIRYRERTYGSTQISRFRHGWLLVKMCWFAARKIKFI